MFLALADPWINHSFLLLLPASCCRDHNKLSCVGFVSIQKATTTFSKVRNGTRHRFLHSQRGLRKASTTLSLDDPLVANSDISVFLVVMLLCKDWSLSIVKSTFAWPASLVSESVSPSVALAAESLPFLAAGAWHVYLLWRLVCDGMGYTLLYILGLAANQMYFLQLSISPEEDCSELVGSYRWRPFRPLDSSDSHRRRTGIAQYTRNEYTHKKNGALFCVHFGEIISWLKQTIQFMFFS